MTASPLPTGAAGTARTVVLLALWTNAAWTLLLPGWLATQVATGAVRAAGWSVLLVHAVVHLLLLRSAVTPSVDERKGRRGPAHDRPGAAADVP